VVKKTATGAPSTDEEVLEKLAEDYPLPAKILEHRSLAKLKGTYTDKLPLMVNPATGRVHTSFAQAVAGDRAAVQQRPQPAEHPDPHAEGRRIREAFVAPPGTVIVSADYSRSSCASWPTSATTRACCAPSPRARTCTAPPPAEVFGLTPDRGEQRAAPLCQGDQLRPDLRHERLRPGQEPGHRAPAAQAYIDRYFARYPGVARYMDETRAERRDKGYVETVFGRRLWLPEINSPMARAARAPSAPPSTRRCRARRPT
jgi:DNA polymerase-1